MGRFSRLFGKGESEPKPTTSGIVVLARTDGYEGFDRPGIGDDVAPERAARARELAAARDIDALRRLLTDLAREGVDGYDLVALGDFAGSAWEFIGFDVAGRDGRSALRPRELLSDHHEAQAFLEAEQAAELVPVGRFRRSALRPGQAVWFTLGNEHNPGDPFGRVVLTIDDAGHVTLEHYSRQGDATYTADVDPEVIATIRNALARGGFPAVPQHQVPGGAAIRQLELVTDDEPRYASMYDTFGQSLPGYDHAFAILDSLTLQLTGHGEHDQTRTPVVNIARVDV